MEERGHIKRDTLVMLVTLLLMVIMFKEGKRECVEQALLDMPQEIYEHITLYNPDFSDEQTVDYYIAHQKELKEMYE